MAKIERKTQKIFGANAGNRSFTAFGTAKSENPVYTQDLDVIQNNAYLYGWDAGLLEDRAPYEEDDNALLYMITSQLAYIFQQGAAIEYDKNTTYYRGAIVATADGSGTWYKSVADDNTGNSLTNTQYWLPVTLNKNGLPLFTQITTDHVLSGDEAVGWAIQGSLVNNSIYPVAYSKILALYNQGSDVTYRGISAKRTTDGRYIADIGQLTSINELFNNTGIADFYIIDTLGQTFYLPKNSRFIQYTTNLDNINQFNDSGLPSLDLSVSATVDAAGNHNHTRGTMNITGTYATDDLTDNTMTPTITGAFYSFKTGFRDADNGRSGGYGIGFDASRSWTGSTSTNGAHTHDITAEIISNNTIYGKTNIVQPPASLKLLYYRVGDTAI